MKSDDVKGLIRLAAMNRGNPPVYSWDAACESGCSYQGYGADELIRILLAKEAEQTCEHCVTSDCTHVAARLILWDVAEAEKRHV